MADIAFESSATAAPGGGATTITITKPTGVVSGDVLVAQIRGAIASGTLTIQTPTGWTLMRHENGSGATQFAFAMFRRVAGGSEPADYTWTYSESASTRAGGISRYSGVDNTTPEDATVTGNSDAGTTATGTGLTTATNGARLILGIATMAATTATTPTGMTSRYTVGRSFNFDEDRATAGATGDRDSTLGASTTWIAIMGALRPESGAAPVEGSVSEGAKFGDVQSAVLTAGAAIAEGLKAGDSWASRLVARASAAEGAKFGDLWSGVLAGVTVQGAIQEGAKAGEEFVSEIRAIAELTEGVKFGDVHSAVLTAGAAIAEGLKAGDSWASRLVARASAAEGAKFGDAWEGTVGIVSGAIVEGTKAGVTFAAAVEALASLAEGAKFADQLAAGVRASAAHIEGARFGDAWASAITTALVQADFLAGAKFGDLWAARLVARASFTEEVRFRSVFALPELHATLILDAIETLAAVEGEVHGYPAIVARSEVEPAVEGEVRVNPKPS